VEGCGEKQSLKMPSMFSTTLIDTTVKTKDGKVAVDKYGEPLIFRLPKEFTVKHRLGSGSYKHVVLCEVEINGEKKVKAIAQ